MSNRVLILNLIKEFLDSYEDVLNDEIDKLIKKNFIINLDSSFKLDLLSYDFVVEFLKSKDLDPSGLEWNELDSMTRCFLNKLKKVIIDGLRIDGYCCSNGLHPSEIKIYVDKPSQVFSSFFELDSLYSFFRKFIAWFWLPVYFLSGLLYLFLCYKGECNFNVIESLNVLIPFPLLLIIMSSTKSYLDKKIEIVNFIDLFLDNDLAYSLLAFSCIIAFHNLSKFYEETNHLNLPSNLVIGISFCLLIVRFKSVLKWMLNGLRDFKIKFKDLRFLMG